jgi:hypothetical protein
MKNGKLENTMARAGKKFIDRVRQVLIEISFEKGLGRERFRRFVGGFWNCFELNSWRSFSVDIKHGENK